MPFLKRLIPPSNRLHNHQRRHFNSRLMNNKGKQISIHLLALAFIISRLVQLLLILSFSSPIHSLYAKIEFLAGFLSLSLSGVRSRRLNCHSREFFLSFFFQLREKSSVKCDEEKLIAQRRESTHRQLSGARLSTVNSILRKFLEFSRIQSP